MVTVESNAGSYLDLQDLLRHLREQASVRAPEAYEAAYPEADEWHTAGFQNEGGAQFLVAAQRPRFSLNQLMKVSTALEAGHELWVVQLRGVNPGQNIKVCIDDLHCEYVPPGVGEALGPLAVNACAVLGGGVTISIDANLSSTIDFGSGKVAFCLEDPCTGRETLTPSTATIKVTTPNVKLEVLNALTWKLVIHLEGLMNGLQSFVESITKLMARNGPEAGKGRLLGSGTCGGVLGGAIDKKTQNGPPPMSWTPGEERLRADEKAFDDIRQKWTQTRLLILRFPIEKTDLHTIAWNDEALNGDFTLRFRPVTPEGLVRLCATEADSIIEIQSRNGGPATLELALKDADSTQPIFRRIFNLGRRQVNSEDIVTARAGLRMQFIVINGTLQPCSCPCCKNNVDIDHLYFVGKPLVNLGVSMAMGLLEDWVMDFLGTVVPKLLRPVVKNALAHRRFQGSNLAMHIGIHGAMGSDKLAIEVTPHDDSELFLEPAHEGQGIVGQILPWLGIEVLDEVVELAPRALLMLSESVLSGLEGVMPLEGGLDVSIPLVATMGPQLDLQMQLPGVTLSAGTESVLRNIAVLSAQPPAAWKDFVTSLGVAPENADDDEGATNDEEDEASAPCFFEPRDLSILPRPNRFTDLSEKLDLQRALQTGDVMTSVTINAETYDLEEMSLAQLRALISDQDLEVSASGDLDILRGQITALAHEGKAGLFDHRLSIITEGTLDLDVRALLMPFLNDPGVEDFGFASVMFPGRFMVKSLHGYMHKEESRAVALGCGELILDGEAKLDFIDGEVTMDTKKDCVKVSGRGEMGQRKYRICGAQAAAVYKAIEEEKARQTRNADRMAASEECAEDLSLRPPIVPSFQWQGKGQLELITNLTARAAFARCIEECGTHPPCRSVARMRQSSFDCKYSPDTSMGGSEMVVSKKWIVKGTQ